MNTNMTIDKACGFCRQSRGFCIDEHTPLGSNVRVFLVRCTQCGATIGVMDYHSTGDIMEDLQKIKDALQIP